MLSDVMIKALSGLKKYHCGYPSYLKGKDKEWKQILGDIIKGFKAANKISEESFKDLKKTKEWATYQKGMKLLVKHFFSLWD